MSVIIGCIGKVKQSILNLFMKNEIDI